MSPGGKDAELCPHHGEFCLKEPTVASTSRRVGAGGSLLDHPGTVGLVRGCQGVDR